MIDRMELGEFYRELRLARGLRQIDVAHENLTVSQLSKFELGQSMLSADKLLLAIEGIQMTFDEFCHKLNNYQDPIYVRIGRKITSLFVKQDIKGLENMLTEIQSFSSVNHYMRLNSIVIKNAIHTIDSQFQLDVEDKEFLTEYLYSIESWTWFELYLFVNTTSIFSDQDLVFLGTSLLDKSESFINSFQNRVYIKQILVNLIIEMLDRNEFKYPLMFEEKLEDILTLHDVFEQILLQFLRKIRIFLETKGSNKKDIDWYIQSLEIIGNPELIALLKLQLQQFGKYNN